MELKDSIEIKTAPEKIWEFFTNLDKNYTTWHPEDHILFKWTEGPPMESGSHFYAEQYVRGKVTQYKGTLGEVIPNRKIVFNLSFPMSIVSPKFEWYIEPKNSHSVFTAVSYMRFGGFYRKLFPKKMEALIELHDKHTRTEAENLRRILEKP